MTDHSADNQGPTREDVLIGRITDAEAGPADWAELENIAASDPGVWQRLATSQRAHARLSRVVEDEIAVAELVDLPSTRSRAVLSRLRQYAGWAIAAVIALAWLGAHNSRIPLRPNGAETIRAGYSTPTEALNQYLKTGAENGRVLGEMPAVLVEMRPAGSGERQEVIYIRQILERTEVEDAQMLNIQQDEHGRPVYVTRPAPSEPQPRAM